MDNEKDVKREDFKDCAVDTAAEPFQITGLLHKGKLTEVQMFDSKGNPMDFNSDSELGWTKKDMRNGSTESSESSPHSPQTTD